MRARFVVQDLALDYVGDLTYCKRLTRAVWLFFDRSCIECGFLLNLIPAYGVECPNFSWTVQ